MKPDPSLTAGHAWHRSASALGLIAALLAGAACGVAPPRFHTLLPLSAAPVPATTPSTSAAALPRWELLPVAVPVQVDQPQMVVRMLDDTIALLEEDRWIAPVADEIRAAVGLRIAQQLAEAGATGGSNLGSNAGPDSTGVAGAAAKRWLLAIEVQRFDSAVGRQVRLEAVWSLRATDSTVPALRCRSVLAQAVGTGVPALAASQRALVAQLGAAMANATQAALAGAALECDAFNAR